MPRKYVLVSSSSSDTSLRYSSEFSRSDSEPTDDGRRRRRGRKRRRDRSSPGPVEPSESLHWWLARWLSSEFSKLAASVFEGGKGCIRYLSNTALRALPSSPSANELLEGTSRVRRSRRRGKRSPLRPGCSGESLKVGKSRKSPRKSRRGHRERSSSPNEAYISLKHKKRSKYGHSPPFPSMKKGSSRSRYRHSLNENWIYEDSWIENLLKEVKSNFKNPVRVKVYKVTPSENSGKSDTSPTDSKLSISIEELVSPTYPSTNSDVISTSSERIQTEATRPPVETSIPKSKGEKKAEPGKHRNGNSLSPCSERKRPAKDLEKLPTPKTEQKPSVSRLSPSDLPSSSPPPRARGLDDKRYHNLSKCEEGVFYPAPGVKCRVVCSSSDGGQGQRVDEVQGEPSGSKGVRGEPVEPVVTDESVEDGEDLLELTRSSEIHDAKDREVPKEEMGDELMRSSDIKQPDDRGESSKEEMEAEVVRELEIEVGISDVSEPDDHSGSLKEDMEVIVSGVIEDSMNKSKDNDGAASMPPTAVPSLQKPSLKQQIAPKTTDIANNKRPAVDDGDYKQWDSHEKCGMKSITIGTGKSREGSFPSRDFYLSQSNVSANASKPVFDPAEYPPVDSTSNFYKGSNGSTSLRKVMSSSSTSGKASMPSVKSTSKQSVGPSELTGTSNVSHTNSLCSGSMPADVGNLLSSVSDPKDKIVVVVSETSGVKREPSSRTTVQSAKKIVESVTDSPNVHSDHSVQGIGSKSSVAQAPVKMASGGVHPGGSQKDLVSIVPSTEGKSVESDYADSNPIIVGSGSSVSCDEEEHRYSVPTDVLPERSNVPVVVTASVATVGSTSRDGNAAKTPSAADQVPQPGASTNDSDSPSAGSVSLPATSAVPPPEAVPSNELLAENSSYVDVGAPKASADMSKSEVSVGQSEATLSLKEDTEQHLTFGDVEKLSYLEVLSGHGSALLKSSSHERFKMLEKPITSKSNLPPIKEETETEGSNRDLSPNFQQQRRQSKVNPGLLKRKSRASTFSASMSTASTFTDISEDSEYSQSMDRCPCKKICDCCTCGRRGSEKASFNIPRSVSKDRPLLDSLASSSSKDRIAVEGPSKSSPKLRPPRIGAIDLSSAPFPKNSFDVLRSPFYAHWDYYDLDQDHPIARYVRRPEQAFDNTDTILVKNVRVGGYTIPYLKVQTKEKVSTKMVCNFYKARKSSGKGDLKKNVMESRDNLAEKSSSVVQRLENGEVKKKCQCKKFKKQEGEISETGEENIWKDFPRDDKSELLDFLPSDTASESSKCSRKALEGCKCTGLSQAQNSYPVPTTPCQSCDCFISDVEEDSLPLIRPVPMSSAVDLSDSADSAERNAVVYEYICELQELCAHLCSMIGKMRMVVDETSASGSTFRSSKASPRGSLPRPSVDKGGNETSENKRGKNESSDNKPGAETSDSKMAL